MTTPLRKYRMHKSSALQRGVEFDLTFDEWMEIWGDRLKDIGTGSKKLGMLRTRDEGGYSVGNVRLGTPKENVNDRSVAYHSSKTHTHRTDSDYRVSLPKEVCFLSNRHNVFKEYVEDEE